MIGWLLAYNLDEESIRLILKKRIKEIVNNYKKYNIKVTVNKDLLNNLVNEVDYFHYGARKINKVLEDKIDSLVISSITSNKKTIKI